MMLKAFSLFDYKADVYSPPFFVSTLGQAVRSVIEAAGDARTTIGRYPQDFALREIGEFNPVTGELVSTPGGMHGTVAQLLNAARAEWRKHNPELPLPGEPPAAAEVPIPFINGGNANA